MLKYRFSVKIVIWVSFFILSQMICTSAFCMSRINKKATFKHSSKQASHIPSQKLLRVGPTSAPPVIDGNLNDTCWRNATMASGFITTGGEWARKQTTAYITYDNTYLYIAFECDEPTPEKIKVISTENDSLQLFKGDVVEIFLDPNRDHQTYYHLGISPNGAHYEASCSVGGKEVFRKSDWNPDLELKTRIGTHSWVSEMRIPFTSIDSGYPLSGAVWGINLTRSRRPGGTVHSSWAMIRGGFNQPNEFGRIVFGSPADVSYSMGSLANQNTAGNWIRFRNGKETSLAIRIQCVWGDVSSSIVLPLGPKEEKEICIPRDIIGKGGEDFPLKGVIDTKEALLTVANDKTGEIYDFRKGVLLYEDIETEVSITVDRYYYTPDIKQMQVTLSRKTKKGSCFKIEIKRDTNGKVLAAKQVLIVPGTDDYVISFDMTSWALGRYIVSARLMGEGSEDLFSVCRVFFKKKIAPAKILSAAPKVSICSDGIILLDGKPFCPFFASKPSSPLAKDCFNVKYGGLGLVSRPLTRQGVGLPGWTREKGTVFTLLPKEEKMLEDIHKVVTTHKTDPLLLYWFMSYEAQIPMYRGQESRVRLNNAEELRKISRFVKSVDPNHLTAIEIDHGAETDYKDSADILEVARYSSSYAKNLIPNLIKDVDELKHSLGSSKPFLFWIGASIPNPDSRIAEEIRCASYLALMHGAAGLVFHMGHGGIPLSSTRHWSVYPGLSREVEELFSILRAPQDSKTKIKITVDSDKIDYCVREYNGRLYLIAVNTSYRLVNATISIKGCSAIPEHVKLLFENREIKSEGNSFRDEFTGLEPHIYKLSLAKRNR
ncbi:MAG: carbohydrate binding family 9 domain-containing protein [bacterium]